MNNVPKKPIISIYMDVKQNIESYINKTMEDYGLPFFMIEGIISSILCDIRSNVINEMSYKSERYCNEMKDFYETQLDKSNENLNELIQKFEKTSEIQEHKKGETD